MKLIIQYDPWSERVASKRAADALKTLGISVHLYEVRLATDSVREVIGADQEVKLVVFE